MSWFKKKPDPISERARELKTRISALEGEIRRLSQEEPEPPRAEPPPPPPSSRPGPQPPPASTRAKPKSKPDPNKPKSPAPRIRSTSRPHEPTVYAQPNQPPDDANPTHAPPRPGRAEPIFEEVGQKANPFRDHTAAVPAPEPDLGIRQDTLSSNWNRLKNHFRGPVTSNPKLVNYLAAGSIQGLRPLRYERRVARNRFIVLFCILVLVLSGLIALTLKR